MWSDFNNSFTFALTDELWKEEAQVKTTTSRPHLLPHYLVKYEFSTVPL